MCINLNDPRFICQSVSIDEKPPLPDDIDKSREPAKEKTEEIEEVEEIKLIGEEDSKQTKEGKIQIFTL